MMMCGLRGPSQKHRGGIRGRPAQLIATLDMPRGDGTVLHQRRSPWRLESSTSQMKRCSVSLLGMEEEIIIRP